MTDAPTDVVDRQLDAYNRGDAESFVGAYAPHAVVRILPDTILLCGRDDIRRHYSGLFAAHPDLKAAVAHRIVCGCFVIDEEIVNGRHSGETVHAVAIYQIEESLISRLWLVPGVMRR